MPHESDFDKLDSALVYIDDNPGSPTLVVKIGEPGFCIQALEHSTLKLPRSV
jgi:hypothetical protein